MFKQSKHRKIALLVVFAIVMAINGFYSYQSAKLLCLGYNAEKNNYDTIASMIYGTILYRYPYTFTATAVRCRIAFQQNAISREIREYKNAGLSTFFSSLQSNLKLSGDKYDYFCIVLLLNSILLAILAGWATNWRISGTKSCILGSIFIISYSILTLLAVNDILPKTYSFKAHAVISALFSLAAVIVFMFSCVIVVKAFLADKVKKCPQCGHLIALKAETCSECKVKFKNCKDQKESSKNNPADEKRYGANIISENI